MVRKLFEWLLDRLEKQLPRAWYFTVLGYYCCWQRELFLDTGECDRLDDALLRLVQESGKKCDTALLVSRLCRLIRQGAQATACGWPEGGTALHHAVYQCARPVVLQCLILAGGANPNRKTKGRETPLHIVCKKMPGQGNMVDVMKVLVDNGARTDLVDRNGYTPFLYLLCRVSSARMDTSGRLLVREKTPLLLTDDTKRLLLQQTIAQSDFYRELFPTMVQHGKFQPVDDHCRSLLHLMALYGDEWFPVLADFLVCPDIWAYGRNSINWHLRKMQATDTLLYDKREAINHNAAAWMDRVKCLTLTPRSDTSISPSGWVPAIKRFDHNRDASGWTPLHTACYTGNHGAVRWLLHNGCSTRTRSNGAQTPIHVACTREQHHLLPDLIAADGWTDFQPRTAWNETCFSLSQKHASTQTLQALCQCYMEERGSILVNDLVGSVGETCLHRACRAGNVQAVRTLLFHCEAKPNIYNAEGRLPLDFAFSMCQEAVPFLLHKGAIESPMPQGCATMSKSKRLQRIKRIYKMSTDRFIEYIDGVPAPEKITSRSGGRCRTMVAVSQWIANSRNHVPGPILAYLDTAIKLRAQTAHLMGGGDEKHRHFLHTLKDCQQVLKDRYEAETWFNGIVQHGLLDEFRKEGPAEFQGFVGESGVGFDFGMRTSSVDGDLSRDDLFDVDFSLEELTSLDDLILSETNVEADATGWDGFFGPSFHSSS